MEEEQASSISEVLLLGGGGFVAKHVIERLAGPNWRITVVDRFPVQRELAEQVHNWVEADLAVVPATLPKGDAIVCFGPSQIDGQHYQRHYRDTAVALSRVVPQLAERRVVLLSTVDVYGTTRGKLTEGSPVRLPAGDDLLGKLAAKLLDRSVSVDEEDLAADLADALSDVDPTGRWAYAHSKRLQEIMLKELVPPDSLTILRLANVYGRGQFRIVSRFVAKAALGREMTATDTIRSFVSGERVAEVVEASLRSRLTSGIYNVSGETWRLPDLAEAVVDELGTVAGLKVVSPRPLDLARDVDWTLINSLLPPHQVEERTVLNFVRQVGNGALQAVSRPINVVVPPAPFEPRILAARTQRCLASGALKHGNVWTCKLEAILTRHFGISDESVVLATNSGTSALRMAVYALAGPAAPGEVAILPSFTFPATAEVLVQLGYSLRFCDVDPQTWTLCPKSLEKALGAGKCRLVVSVDALGCPCDYDALHEVCSRHGATLVADSAAALGATYNGQPIGRQAAAHAFSMSFAKVVSAGGTGGAVVLPRTALSEISDSTNWWRSSQMTEMAAIVALDLLERLDTLVERRAAVARVYSALSHLATPQSAAAGSQHAWVHWAALFPDRDKIAEQLARLGIGTKPYYAPALHFLPWNGAAELIRELPITEKICSQVLALPMSSELDEAQAEQIAFTVHRLLQDNWSSTLQTPNPLQAL